MGCVVFCRLDEAGDLKAAVATFDTMRPSSLDSVKQLGSEWPETYMHDRSSGILNLRTSGRAAERIDLCVPARGSAVLPNKTSYNILVNAFAQAVLHVFA